MKKIFHDTICHLTEKLATFEGEAVSEYVLRMFYFTACFYLTTALKNEYAYKYNLFILFVFEYMFSALQGCSSYTRYLQQTTCARNVQHFAHQAGVWSSVCPPGNVKWKFIIYNQLVLSVQLSTCIWHVGMVEHFIAQLFSCTCLFCVGIGLCDFWSGDSQCMCGRHRRQKTSVCCIEDGLSQHKTR